MTTPDGTTVRLTVGDPPLGTGHYRGALETVEWPVGARLTMYTDGLVEHRGSDLDIGITALAAALGAARDLAVQAMPGALVDAVSAEHPDDDVAVLVAELRHVGRPRAVQFALRLTAREIVIEVADAEQGRPQVRPFNPGAPNGRGLHMVESLGAQWGVRPTGQGKSVWCTIPCAAPDSGT